MQNYIPIDHGISTMIRITRFSQLALVAAILCLSFSGSFAEEQTSPSGSPPVSADVVNTSLTNQTVNISVVAKNMAFNVTSITVPAGANVSILFENQDAAPHNIAFYESSKADTPLFIGDIISSPESIVYTFTAPETAGTYFFRCDVHPAKMTGDFIVT